MNIHEYITILSKKELGFIFFNFFEQEHFQNFLEKNIKPTFFTIIFLENRLNIRACMNGHKVQ